MPRYVRELCDFVGFGEADAATVRESAPVVLEREAELTGALYEHFLKFPESARFFLGPDGAPDAARIERRKHSLGRWLRETAQAAVTQESSYYALAWSRARGVALRMLGGGSNVVVADAGVEALVVRVGLRGVTTREAGRVVDITAAAGEPWDDLVALAVARGWAGLECLSGIPGLVGATPMQNVGAYGQEVSDTVVAVRALDTTAGEAVTLSPAECGFAYRDSAFKSRELGRYVVLAVTYRLRPGAAPTLGYADVERAVGARDGRRGAEGVGCARRLRASAAERCGVRPALGPAVGE